MRKCISVNFVFFVIALGFKRNEIAIMIYRNGFESEHMLLFFSGPLDLVDKVTGHLKL